MEPRARAGRHKSGLNFGEELSSLLYGTGTPAHPDHLDPLPDSNIYLRQSTTSAVNKTHPPTAFTRTSAETTLPAPFPETLRVLDEIITDFIIETSHAALAVATYAGRAKLKYTDFEFVMRRDRKKLGRMQDMMARRRKINEAKKMTGVDDPEGGQEGKVRMPVKDMQDFADFVGEEGTGRGRGKGRGRRKKRSAEEAELEGGAAGGEGGGEKGAVQGTVEDLDDVDVDMDDLEGDGTSHVDDGAGKQKAKKTKA